MSPGAGRGPACCSTPSISAGAQHRLDVLGGETARAQQPRVCARDVDDGGFEAEPRRAAVQNCVDAAIEVLEHVLDSSRARAREEVRARRCDWLVGCSQQRLSNRVRWDSHGDRLQTRCHFRRHGGCLVQDQRQRPWPESLGQPFGQSQSGGRRARRALPRPHARSADRRLAGPLPRRSCARPWLSRASAPRPYTVSVGKATRPPWRRICPARATPSASAGSTSGGPRVGHRGHHRQPGHTGLTAVSQPAGAGQNWPVREAADGRRGSPTVPRILTLPMVLSASAAAPAARSTTHSEAPDPHLVWQSVLAHLASRTSEAHFDLYLRGTRGLAYDPGASVLRVAAANPFHVPWLEGKFSSAIHTAVAEVVGYPIRVEFVDQAATSLSNGRDRLTRPAPLLDVVASSPSRAARR